MRRKWSIGLYRGDSPLSLRPMAGVKNPVLTEADVSDVAAHFVADPFMIFRHGTWYMFFEVMRRDGRGEIGLATSSDGGRWTYRQIVLRESFHLSYPHVFEWQGEIYMLPEHPRPRYLQLYRATDFPTRWSPVETLIEGRHADASLLSFADRWWLFAGIPPRPSSTLGLYVAERPTGPWRVHPKSPIVRDDARIARPAGRMLVWKGAPLRFTQDCHGTYGLKVRAFRITHLTPTEYREEPASEKAVLEPGGDGWNGSGMHHLDAHLAPGGGWIACVDGHFSDEDPLGSGSPRRNDAHSMSDGSRYSSRRNNSPGSSPTKLT